MSDDDIVVMPYWAVPIARPTRYGDGWYVCVGGTAEDATSRAAELFPELNRGLPTQWKVELA